MSNERLDWLEELKEAQNKKVCLYCGAPAKYLTLGCNIPVYENCAGNIDELIKEI